MDFEYSPRTQELQKQLLRFMDEHIYPAEQRYEDEIEANTKAGKRWTPLQTIEELKPKARAQGLWNLFLPPTAGGKGSKDSGRNFGLSNGDYAPLAEIMGRVPWSSEVFNCSAPDTGNMETIERYGSAEHKERWLQPLLDGKIRSAFAMTEPAVASSDATNIEARIGKDGSDYVINGRKWWTSGAGDPRCKIYIFMGKTDFDAPRHSQQSMVLVPADTPGHQDHPRRSRCSATTTRRTATWKWRSTTCACRSRTSCSAKGAASRSPRAGSGRDGSTTACA